MTKAKFFGAVKATAAIVACAAIGYAAGVAVGKVLSK